MTKLFSQSLKDSGRVGLLLSVFFFAGIVTSSFVLFMLPHDLTFKGHLNSLEGVWGVLIPLFICVSITFLLGVAAVTVALLGKKETIVYLEKKKNGKAGQQDIGATTTDDLNIVKSFKNSIQNYKGQSVLEEGLTHLCKLMDAGQGALYLVRSEEDKRVVELHSGYALNKGESSKIQYEFGEGLIGQAALNGNSLYLDEVPEGYITVLSGLGSASAKYLFIVVLKSGDETKGVMELATFSPIKESVRKQIDEAGKILAEKIS